MSKWERFKQAANAVLTTVRNVAAGVGASCAVLASSAEVFNGDAPSWWHEVTLSAVITGVVCHAVVAGTTPKTPAA